MEVAFIPTWPQKKQELREAKLPTELPRTSENTEAAFILLQEREDGSAFGEPKSTMLTLPNTEDFYPTKNVTVFGDIAFKDMMMLKWGV